MRAACIIVFGCPHNVKQFCVMYLLCMQSESGVPPVRQSAEGAASDYAPLTHAGGHVGGHVIRSFRYFCHKQVVCCMACSSFTGAMTPCFVLTYQLLE
jgi:hypothetical protein